MADILRLGFGDNPATAYVDLTPYLAEGGFRAPAPDVDTSTVAGPTRHGAELVLARYQNRDVTVRLNLNATSPDMLDRLTTAINNYLDAARTYGLTGRGQAVVLTYRRDGQMGYRYFDVLYGSLDMPDDYMGVYLAQNRVIGAELQMTCRPLARGDAVLMPASASLMNTAAAVLDVPNVPGDAAALLQVRLVDLSGTSGGINRVRIGVASEREGGDPATKLFAVSTPASGSAINRGWTDSLSGTVAEVSPAAIWTTIAEATVTTNLGANRGLHKVLVRCKDVANAASIPPPIASGTIFGGSLTAFVTYTYTLTAVNANGETLPTNTTSKATSSTAKTIELNWSPANGATSYNLYRSTDGGATWQHRSVGNVYVYDDDGTAADWVSGAPPTVGAQAGPMQVRVRYGLPTDPDTNLQETPGVPLQGAGRFELVDFGVLRLPPGTLPAGASPAGWRIQVQVRRDDAVSGVGQVDGVYLFALAGTYVEAWYPSLDSAACYTWLLETGVDERLAVSMASAALVPQLTPVGVGALAVQPGNNRIFATASKAADLHTTLASNTRFSLQARYVPRYRTVT